MNGQISYLVSLLGNYVDWLESDEVGYCIPDDTNQLISLLYNYLYYSCLVIPEDAVYAVSKFLGITTDEVIKGIKARKEF